MSGTDLKKNPPNHYHFIGIGGIGMSALARLALDRYSVSGSDIKASHITESLQKLGAEIKIGHESDHVQKHMTVVISSDIQPANPEWQHALKLGCPILHRSDLLHHFMQEKKSLAVAGTHGKTTTSSLLSWILKETHCSDSFAVGGIIQKWNCHSGWGKGDYFVAEADESDGSFLKYHPFGAIITNIDNDHMNFYQTQEALDRAFISFASHVKENNLLLYCLDDAGLQRAGIHGTSYGFSHAADICVTDSAQMQNGSRFDLKIFGKEYNNWFTPLLGKHNILNSAAAIGLCVLLGLNPDDIKKALQTFPGVKRRAEFRSAPSNILLVDDYAHHPTEIKTTLEGLKSAYPNRKLWAVFQPHRYSRMATCIDQFKDCFQASDNLLITEIYSAGETPIPRVTTEEILRHLVPYLSIPYEQILRSDIALHLESKLKEDDLVVFLGAGDITKAPFEVLERLNRK